MLPVNRGAPPKPKPRPVAKPRIVGRSYSLDQLSKIGGKAAPAKSHAPVMKGVQTFTGPGIVHTLRKKAHKIVQANNTKAASKEHERALGGSKKPNTGGGAKGKNKGGKGGGGGKGKGGGSASSSSSATRVTSTKDPFLERAKNYAGIEYNPKLNEIARAITSTQTEGAKNKSQLASMFAGLAKSGEAGATDISKIIGDAQAKSATNLAGLQSQIENSFAGQNAADKTALERLGISDLGNQSTVARGTEQQVEKSTAGNIQQNIAGALSVIGAGNQGTMKQLAEMARSEGVVRQSDLQNQITGQVGAYRGQRTDLLASRGRMERELSEQYRQEQFSNELAKRQFGLQEQTLAADINKSKSDQKRDALELKVKSQIAAADAAIKAGKNATPYQKLVMDINRSKSKGESAADYVRVLNSMMADQSVANGKVNGQAAQQQPNRMVKDTRMTPMLAAQRAVYLNRQQPKSKRVNENLLRQYALTYYKQGAGS